MGLIGSIDPYVQGTSFSHYVEQMEFIFSSNDIVEGKKKDIFLSLCGVTVFQELKRLYPATDLKTVSYADIIKKLKERYDKVESDIVMRYKFRCRVQGPNETNENFLLDVKLLAETCDFGEFRDSAIRDQLVYGVYDKDLQQKLLDEEKLTLKIAERILKTKEVAAKSSQAINRSSGVHSVSVRQRLGWKDSTDNRRVYGGRDGERKGRERSRYDDRRSTYHHGSYRSRSRSQTKGRYSNFICHYCNARGHIQKNCYKFLNQQKHAVQFVGETSSVEDPHEYFKRLRKDYDSDADSDRHRSPSPNGPQGADKAHKNE
ncbi:uncharacterized protein LOC134289597 [Aedes albopictus]|uniref:CCHC-type domain-containing protein n=1 Tax=Aedes albopictus TaxID=7160 RepID=A0ABM1Z9W4_AEDAL|nr:uncharacterized protein LOC115260812 [Aedes albopictus]